MSALLEELLNDISLQLLTASEDPAGLKKLCARFQEEAQKSGAPSDVAAIFQSVLADSSLDTANLVELVSTLVSRAQRALAAHISVQPVSVGGDDSAADLSPELDAKLIAEFIEKHSSLLEEMEGNLMAQLDGGSATPPEEFLRQLKGYIHNLKGDAGSVGVLGVERACHVIEDIIPTCKARALIEPLLDFKAWASAALTALASNKPLPEASTSFLERFRRICAEASETQTVLASSSGNSDLPPEANLALLAELMGEAPAPSAAPAAPAVAAAPAAPAARDTATGSSDTYTMSVDPDIFNEFTGEAEDHLAAIETTLLEAQGNFDKEAIDKIFRAAHSLKGASSYFKLEEIRETSHVTEDLLDEVRAGKRNMDQGLIDLLLIYKDLELLLLNDAKQAVKRDGVIKRSPRSKQYMEQLAQYKRSGAGPSAAAGTPREAANGAPSAAAPATAPNADAGNKLDVKTFVKVDTKRLDQLIDSIGEMVIYSSMLIQRCRAQLAGDEGLVKTTHQVEKFARDLQNIGMSMRLIPIRGLFQKMSRLVWDTAKKIGKEIKFTMEGEDTELDRNIIDQLADPLMHMIRNAIDHGIEPPEEREKKHKSRVGSIQLRAYHAGGSIHIEITDDGRGLNPEKLLAKAREKGIVLPGQQLSLAETYQLIFAAGFSTAAVVTDISGRGVGMDVVRRNIEGMRGHVHIRSEIDRGTVFTIELPLTLAIIDGILVRVAKEQFIVPTLSIVELTNLSEDAVTHALDRGETFHFRGRSLPLFRLGRLFQLESKDSQSTEGTVIVAESNGEQTAILVDEVLGSYSTVIKNLSDIFTNREGVAGCAIMSNGDVSLILDVRSLVVLARREYRYITRALPTAAQGAPTSSALH